MRKKLVFTGILLAAISAAVVALWNKSGEKRAEREMRNLETEVVRIELAGQKFDIPMRYMYGQAIEKHGQWPAAKKERVKVDALTLSVLLPDLRPYSPEDDARWKVRGHGDRVEVTIAKLGAGERGWAKWLLNRIEKESAEQPGTPRRNQVYGLDHFATPVFDEYFPVDRPDLNISCDRKQAVPSPSCKTKSNYRTGTVLEYYYGAAHLPRWREIDTALKGMFDEFLQPQNDQLLQREE